MKYVIDVPDNADYVKVIYEKNGSPVDYYSSKINDLDLHSELCKEDIENKVWEFVKELLSYNSISIYDIGKIYGTIYITDIVNKYSYQEAKNKHEVWMKNNSDFRKGEEVRFNQDNSIAVVVGVTDNSVRVLFFDEDGYGRTFPANKNDVTKTGRFFDEISKLYEKMSEKEQCCCDY